MRRPMFKALTALANNYAGLKPSFTGQEEEGTIAGKMARDIERYGYCMVEKGTGLVRITDAGMQALEKEGRRFAQLDEDNAEIAYRANQAATGPAIMAVPVPPSIGPTPTTKKERRKKEAKGSGFILQSPPGPRTDLPTVKEITE